MKIYVKKPQFNASTGKPIEPKYIYDHDRCDMTGRVLKQHDPKRYSYPAYRLDYKNQDPCCGSEENEFEFGGRFNIDMHQFLLEPYNFNFKDEEEHTITGSIAMAFRAMRVKTATSLIEEGEITPDQLTGYNDEYRALDEDEE